MSIQYRDYQERDIKDIISSWDKVHGIMYQLPTGGGKSVVSSAVIAKVQEGGKRVLVMAHRRELIFQLKEHLQNRGLNPGVVISDIEENLDSNIIVGSIATLTRDRRIETILVEPFDYVVVDEAHRLRTPSYDKVLDHLKSLNPEMKLLGITATPYRTDKLDFRRYIDKLIISDSPDVLIKKGFLSEARTFSTSVGDIDKEVIQYSDDYQTASLSVYMMQEKYLNYLVSSYKKNGQGRQMLVYAVSVKHAKAIVDIYRDSGYESIGYIDGETDPRERDGILESFRRGELQIIVSIGTLTEGVDLPNAGCIQIARPTQSLTLYLQMIGRGSRITEKYKDFIVLDCGGCTQKFGTFTSKRKWSLNPDINPSSPSKKNRVVGVKEDGTYTENLEELDHLELVELTPEQYLTKMNGNIEQAVEQNKVLDKEMQIIAFELGKQILVETGLEKVMVCKESITGSTVIIRFNFQSGSNEGSIELVIRDEHKYLSMTTPWSSMRTGNFPHAQLYIAVGKIQEAILDKKYKVLFEDKINAIQSLNEEKTDIDELKISIQKFKEEHLLKEIEEMLKNGRTSFTFSRPMSLERISNRMYGYATRIVFSRDKLLSYNEVEFYTDWETWNNNRTGEEPRYVDSYKYLSKEMLVKLLLDEHSFRKRNEKGEWVYDKVIVWDTLQTEEKELA